MTLDILLSWQNVVEEKASLNILKLSSIATMPGHFCNTWYDPIFSCNVETITSCRASSLRSRKWTDEAQMADTDILPTQIVDILEDVQEEKEDKTDTSISDDDEDNDSGTKMSSVSDNASDWDI